jgi:hypothetical protein
MSHIKLYYGCLCSTNSDGSLHVFEKLLVLKGGMVEEDKRLDAKS